MLNGISLQYVIAKNMNKEKFFVFVMNFCNRQTTGKNVSRLLLKE